MARQLNHPKLRLYVMTLHFLQLRVLPRCLRTLCYAALGLALAGCFSIPTKSGTTYHVIIGFGVVAVSDPKQTALVATDAHSLGIAISDRPSVRLSVGYASSSVVTVAADAQDVRVEVSRKPWGPLVVDTQSAKLQGNTSTTDK